MMQSLRAACLGAGLVSAVLAYTGPAVGASQRTFVSTSGSDNLTCSLVAPCRAFTAAIAATNPGGEVIVLDSGGYGPVTIAQSASIIAPPGVYAGISVLSGHGVTIAGAVTDTIVLRGLTINNQGSTGRGIFISGAGVVRIEDVQVSGFTSASALNATPSDALQLHVRRSVFRKSNFGIALNHNNPAATSQISGTFEQIEITNNATDGLGIGSNVIMTLSRSLVTKNDGLGVGFSPETGQFNQLSVDDCQISENQQGLYPGDKPGTSKVQVSRSRIVGNGTGISAGANSFTWLSDSVIHNNGYGIVIPVLGGGVVMSAGDNVLHGNGAAEPVLTTFPLR